MKKMTIKDEQEPENDDQPIYVAEAQKGYKYRGKVNEEVFYHADDRKRATTTIK